MGPLPNPDCRGDAVRYLSRSPQKFAKIQAFQVFSMQDPAIAVIPRKRYCTAKKNTVSASRCATKEDDAGPHQ
jgi:hypothetical protein